MKLRKVFALTLVGMTLAVGGAVFGATIAPDGSLPRCASENSPRCVWVDPHTHVEYVNGDDAGMSLEERCGCTLTIVAREGARS